MSAGFAVGFFGKLPARGDFVGVGLPGDLVGRWDRWLSGVMAVAERKLGAAWEDRFTSAPVWRFALAGGLCGDVPMTGILMPSADRVGRRYPFTVAATLPPGTDLALVPGAALDWFARAESIAADACRAGADVEALPARMAILGRPYVEDADPALAAAVLDRVGPLSARSSLWWSRGGGRLAPSLLACEGLPAGTRPLAFLDGHWARWGWDDLAGPDAGVAAGSGG